MSLPAHALQSETAVSLLRAVLGPACDEDDARSVLAAAEAAGVDPLQFCERRLGVPIEAALARAAEWAGLRFVPALPPEIPANLRADRIEQLSGIGIVQIGEGAHSLTYFTPSFGKFMQLRDHLAVVPGFARRVRVVPAAAIRTMLTEASRDELLDAARQRLVRQWRGASASQDTPIRTRIGFVLALLAVTGLVASASFWMKPLVLPLVGLVLVIPALFRLLSVLRPAPRRPEPTPLPEADLPVYSILLPLRDEAAMVPMLHRAMQELDYPPERLDIKFVVEESSTDTVAAVQTLGADSRFELVMVPEALPGTKPKALNYALPLVQGELLVVYDAEDLPEPDQLRRAAARMAADATLDCLQAELVVDNAGENLLTALFAGEYAGQFGFALPLLGHWRLPMPLGGTSNHFRMATLREIGGWDAFNVTEDADLGVRLARRGCRTEVFDSRTGEEAPISFAAWMNQRTRWMKGWMQTFIVHNRHPRALLADLGWTGFLAFQIYVGSMMLSAPLHTVFMLVLVFHLATGSLPAPEGGWDALALCVLAVGYSGALALAIAGLVRIGRPWLVAAQLLLPAYWLLHSVAALRAGHELLTRPHFWSKTAHGRTRMRRAPTAEPVQPSAAHAAVDAAPAEGA